MLTQPIELILSQFAYLEPLDLYRCERVCRVFRVLARDLSLWKRISSRDFNNPQGDYEFYKQRVLYELKLRGVYKTEISPQRGLTVSVGMEVKQQIQWIRGFKIVLTVSGIKIFQGIQEVLYLLFPCGKVEDIGYGYIHLFNNVQSVVINLANCSSFRCRERGRIAITDEYIICYKDSAHVYDRKSFLYYKTYPLLSYVVKDFEFIGRIAGFYLVINKEIWAYSGNQNFIPCGRMDAKTLIVRDEEKHLYTFNLQTFEYASLDHWGVFLCDSDKFLLFSKGIHLNLVDKQTKNLISSTIVGSPLKVVSIKNEQFLLQQKEEYCVLDGVSGKLWHIKKKEGARYMGSESHLFFFGLPDVAASKIVIYPWSFRTKDFITPIVIHQKEVKEASSIFFGYEVDVSVRNSLTICYSVGRFYFDFYNRDSSPGRVVHRQWSYITPNAR